MSNFNTIDAIEHSAECTNHSVAKGRKRADAQPDLFGEVLPDAAAERSRATMWDVPRFAEVHQYQAVIVENVVESARWLPYRAWIMAMDSLGYNHQAIYLNSMHARRFGDPAPQSRDRKYDGFWRKGNPRPDFEQIVRPDAVCPNCGPVSAMQAWKRPDREPWGRYRAQYVFRCPNVACRNQVIEPDFRAAEEIIDWSLLGTRIGDRENPLSDKTMARVRGGIDKYWLPLLVPVEGREGKQAQPVSQPARTMTTRSETGLAFIAELRGGGSKHRPVSEPLATLTASGTHHGLVTTYYGKGGTRSTGEALPTVTAVEKHALLMRHHTARGDQGQMSTPISEPARTMMANGPTPALLAGGPTIDVDDVLFRMLEPREIARAMDFPADYTILGNRREQVRQAGNAVTPPAARDLVGVVAESLGVVA